MTEAAYFLDHAGRLVGPWPVEPYPVGRDPVGAWNHRLMRPPEGQLIQAVSWCGHRAHEPATGPVDCPECLAEMGAGNESSSTQSSPAPHNSTP